MNVFTTTRSLFLCLALLPAAQLAHAQELEPAEPQLPPGVVESVGTYLEITDSEYLNVSLESSVVVDAALQSVPRSIVVHVAAVDEAPSTVLTLHGLEASATYYRYEDTLDVGISFSTDEVGSFSFVLDIVEPRVVYIHEAPSTIFLAPGSGSIPTEIGWWNPNTRVFTLTSDVYESIQIGEDDLILEGAGFRIIGAGTGSGIYVPSRHSVTVRNTVVEGFSFGIHYYRSHHGTVANNTITNSGRAVYISVSSSAAVIDNTMEGGSEGIGIHRNSHYAVVARNHVSNTTGSCITNSLSALSSIEDNVVTGCGYGAIANWQSYGVTISGNVADDSLMGLLLGWADNATLRDNAAAGNDINFKVWGTNDYNWSHDIDTSNTLDGRPLYYVVGVQDAVFDEATDAASFWAIDCARITVKNLVVSGNSSGVYFRNTHDSRVENVTATGNQEHGIALVYSNGNTVIGNHIATSGLHGLVVRGDGNVISSNTSTDNYSWQRPGIWVYGANNTVSSNTSTANAGDGYWLSGSDSSATDNYAEANQNGFKITSCVSCEFSNNATVGASGYGFLVRDNTGGSLVANSALGAREGFYLYNASGLLIDANTAQGNTLVALRLSESSGNTVTDNSIQSDSPASGLRITNSPTNTLSGNAMTGSGQLFALEGWAAESYEQSIDDSNTLNGGALLYVNGETGRVIDETTGAAAVYAVSSNSLVVRNLELSQVVLYETDNSLIENVTVDNGGVDCQQISPVVGMDIRFSDNNVVVGNTIRCNYRGLYLYNSSGNQIYHNNFLENFFHANANGGTDNLFNVAMPDGGNFWDDWTGPDANNDGIVDQAYRIASNPYVYDHYPWTVASGWESPELLVEQLVGFVEELNLEVGIENGFDAKLEAAQQALTDVNKNNDVAAVNSLEAFVNSVEAQRGNKLTDEQTDNLVALAQAIIAKLTTT